MNKTMSEKITSCEEKKMKHLLLAFLIRWYVDNELVFQLAPLSLSSSIIPVGMG